MEDEVLIRSRSELDMVLVNVEAAVKVNKRLDFFSWVQGVFQGIIAHEALVCGIPHPPARRVRFEWLASYPISDDRFGDLCRHDGGVMHELSDRWEQGGRAPPASRRNTGRGFACRGA